jgi:hypothetical protein
MFDVLDHKLLKNKHLFVYVLSMLKEYGIRLFLPV